MDWVVASVVSVANSLVGQSSILRFGTDAQKERWLPRHGEAARSSPRPA